LEAVVKHVPPPRLANYPQARVLVFDSVYDSYKGVICYVRIFSGTLSRGDKILLMKDNVKAEIKEVGIFTPQMKEVDELTAGNSGYIVTNIKAVSDIKMGDTITLEKDPAQEMLAGYQEIRPMVYSGIYSLDTSDYQKLKSSMGKLRLNDAAFTFQAESSVALGFGFRCGFLGLLHMEIIQERIRREYDVDIIATYPSVVYKIKTTDHKFFEVDNPVNLPDPETIEYIEEPMIVASIHLPGIYIGDILALVMDKRGFCEHTETLDETRLMITCRLPLNEVLVDFNDKLKSITKGYGSMDYEFADYQRSKLVKLDILVNAEPVDAFSSIVHVDKAEGKGRELCKKLKDILPRQMFKIPVQATIGGKVVARETLSAFRKDVTAKCYGGDISRKRKLLDKQKEGKKRMKQIGKVSIPQEAFIDILKSNT